MSNELMRSDGFNEPLDDNQVICGALVKCVDGQWKTGDGISIPSGTRLLVLTTTSVVQCWRDQKPTETIFKKAAEPLPDVGELNAQIPVKEWELDLNGQPRPPWGLQMIVYLLDASTAEKFTFASGTIGAKRAVRELRDRVQTMRALRSENVVPVVELADKPMPNSLRHQATSRLSNRGVGRIRCRSRARSDAGD